MLLKRLSSKLIQNPRKCILPAKYMRYDKYSQMAKDDKKNRPNDILTIYYNRNEYSSEHAQEIDNIQQMTYSELLIMYKKKELALMKNPTRRLILKSLIDQIPKQNTFQATEIKIKDQHITTDTTATTTTTTTKTSTLYANINMLTRDYYNSKYKDKDKESSKDKGIKECDNDEIGNSFNRLRAIMNHDEFYKGYMSRMIDDGLDMLPNIALSNSDKLELSKNYHQVTIEDVLNHNVLFDKEYIFDSISIMTRHHDDHKQDNHLHGYQYLHVHDHHHDTHAHHHHEAIKHFKDIMLLNKEYCLTPYQSFNSYLRKKKYDISACLQAIMFLDNPINYYLTIPFLKHLESNALIPFWNSIFSSIQKYDLVTIDSILKLMQKFKSEFKLNFDELVNEGNILAEISTFVLTLINSHEDYLLLRNLSSILHNLRILSDLVIIGISKQITDNIENISGVVFKMYSEHCIDKTLAQLSMPHHHYYQIFIALINNTISDKLSKILPDLYAKLVELDLKNMDKSYIKELLVSISKQKLRITKEISEHILENSKILDDLQLDEIYLIITAFNHSDINLNYSCPKLTDAVFSLIGDSPYISNYKDIVLVSKILDFIISSQISINNGLRGQFEKRLLAVMELIDKSLANVKEKIDINDLLEMSSIIIHHMNIPDYLFNHIIQYINELKITTDNIDIISKFMDRLLDRLDYKYSMNINLHYSFIDFNDKLTPNILNVIKNIANKLRESNQDESHILHMKILTNIMISQSIYPNLKQRKEILNHLLGQILKSNEGLKCLLIYNQITLFLNNNIKELNPKLVIILLDKLFNQLNAKWKRAIKPFNRLLPSIYNLSNCLASIKKNIHTKGETKNRVEIYLTNMKLWISNNIILNFCDNNKYTVENIVYDKNVSQIFNPNILNSNFKHLEYLLPIMHNINTNITNNIKQSIIIQYPRCVKLWNGYLLLTNLILLNEYKIYIPQVYEYAAQNLFTLFIYDISTKNMIVNTNIIKTNKEIIDLLKAYISQYKGIHSNQFLIKEDQVLNKFTTGLGTYKTLGILLNTVIDELNIDEIIDIMRIIGSKKSNYPKQFIEKFQKLTFENINFEKALLIKVEFPKFLTNAYIEDTVISQISINYRKNLFHSAQVLISDRIYNLEILNYVKKELNLFRDLKLFKSYLHYLAYYINNITDYDFIITYTMNKQSQLDDDDLTNFLFITLMYIYNNKQNTNNDKNTLKKKFYNELKKEQYDFLEKTIERLLQSEEFLFFENNITEKNGVFHHVQYYPSLTMDDKTQILSYKILPMNQAIQFIKNYPNLFQKSNMSVNSSGDNNAQTNNANMGAGGNIISDDSSSNIVDGNSNPNDDNNNEASTASINGNMNLNTSVNANTTTSIGVNTNTRESSSEGNNINLQATRCAFSNEEENILAENLNNIDNAYNDIARKYYIYLEYSNNENNIKKQGGVKNKNERDIVITVQNEELSDAYSTIQDIKFHAIKFKAKYTNFFLDINTILFDLNIQYNSNYACNQTGISIDIAFRYRQCKIAVLYVEYDDLVLIQKDIDDGNDMHITSNPNQIYRIENESYCIDNLTLIKGKTLENKGDWQIIYIVYDIWNTQDYTDEQKRDHFKSQVEDVINKYSKQISLWLLQYACFWSIILQMVIQFIYAYCHK